VCAYEDPSIVQALCLDRLRAGGTLAVAPQLRRYRVPLGGGRGARSEPLVAEPMELPRIDYRTRNARPYRYAYGAGVTSGAGFINQLVKADIESGQTRTWREEGCYPGEPVFVPSPDQRTEDDGVILSVVLDARSESSFLLILSAGTLEELARAQAPQRIPFGLHGDYFPDRTPVQREVEEQQPDRRSTADPPAGKRTHELLARE
jgi:carotenoid cleavage dioxygenase-like enzyme